MPMLGPDGIDLVPANDEPASLESDLPPYHMERDAATSKSVMNGGMINFCGVPGSACEGHRRDESDVSQHMDYPSIAHSESFLKTPMPTHPHITGHPPHPAPTPHTSYVGPNGVVLMPPDQKDESVLSQHIDAPTIAHSESFLMTPRPTHPHITTRPAGPPPHVPYVGSNGIVHMTRRERDAQVMKGGSIGVCGVPGEACEPGHRRIIETSTPSIAAPLITHLATCRKGDLGGCERQMDVAETLTLEMKPPHTESSMDYLMGQVIKTTYWISGTMYTPPPYTVTMFYFHPASKRALAESTPSVPALDDPAASAPSHGAQDGSSTAVELAEKNVWARMEPTPALDDSLTSAVAGGSQYTSTTAVALAEGNLWARSPIQATPALDTSATSAVADDDRYAGATTVALAEKNVWARSMPSPSPTPTTFSYAASVLLQRTPPADLYPQEGSIRPSASSDEQGHISSVTCLPVVVMDHNGVPSGTGCLAPENVSITKSEPIIVAGTTSTATLPTGNNPWMTGTNWKYNALADPTADREVASAASRRSIAVVGACVAVVGVLAAIH